MFIKETSTDEYMRTAVAVILQIIIYMAFPNFSRSQEKPSFDKPFKICRTYANNGGRLQSVASDNNKNIIFTNENNVLVSVNPETNFENWKSQTGGKIYPNIVSDEQSFYYLSSFESESLEKTYILNSISQKTGITNWQKKLDGYADFRLFDASDKDFIYLAADSQYIFAINKKNGNTNWTKNINPKIISLNTMPTNRLSVLTAESIIKVSTQNGEILSEIRIKKNPISNSVKNSSYILLGYPNGEFIKVAAEERIKDFLWKVKAGGSISSLIEIDKETLVSSLDNFLYLYSTSNGKLKWKRRVSGRINVKPVIYDNFAVVLSSSDNIASIVELEEGKIINQIKIEEDNYFSDEPLILGRLIIFPTFRGIYLFVNSDQACK